MKRVIRGAQRNLLPCGVFFQRYLYREQRCLELETIDIDKALLGIGSHYQTMRESMILPMDDKYIKDLAKTPMFKISQLINAVIC